MSKGKNNGKRLTARSSFDTPLSMNLYVGIATYCVLAVYCIICLLDVDAMFVTVIDGKGVMTEKAEQAKLIYILQFCMDSFFPSTLTLVISIIIQNIVEIANLAKPKWGWTGIVITFTLVYTMFGSGLRLIQSANRFKVIAGLTVLLLLVSFVAIYQLQKHSEQGGRIAAQQ